MGKPGRQGRTRRVVARGIRRWSCTLPLPVLVSSILVINSPASAQKLLAPEFAFGAFGTLGLIYSGESHADFVENFSRSEGPGFNSVNANTDSRVAGQASALFGPRLKMVAQLMVEQNTDGEYTPRAEWANVSYLFTPDFSIRGGRIAMPAFLVSDFRKVSFVNVWVRPPVRSTACCPSIRWTARMSHSAGILESGRAR